MDAGGISRRIVEFATALVGWVVGSLLMVSVVAATGLAAISGSGSADVAAISSIMQPELRRRRYDIDFSARGHRLPALVLRAAALSAAVMIIIGTASIFGWLVANANVPALLAAWIKTVSEQPWTYLLLINVLLMLIGMFMESIAAILILIPVLMPIAIDFGIDPAHFGLVVVMNFAIGMVTPPYGDYPLRRLEHRGAEHRPGIAAHVLAVADDDRDPGAGDLRAGHSALPSPTGGAALIAGPACAAIGAPSPGEAQPANRTGGRQSEGGGREVGRGRRCERPARVHI